MRGLRPIAGLLGAAALGSVGWELWRLLWLRGLHAGVVGRMSVSGAVGIPNGGWGSYIVLPIVLCLGWIIFATVSSLVSTRGGRLLFGVGGVSLLGWALTLSVVAVFAGVDSLDLPVFVVLEDPQSSWSPWGRWLLDGGLLFAGAMLLGLGPRTPLARRGIWTLCLIVLAESGWRAAVSFLGGHIPALGEGFRALGWLQQVVWLVFGLLAVGFVGLFANLPSVDGPKRIAVIVVLAVAGLWLGLQGALLWTVGLLDAMGTDGVLFWPTPGVDAQLAWLRLFLYLTAGVSLVIASWREPPAVTTAS